MRFYTAACAACTVISPSGHINADVETFLVEAETREEAEEIALGRVQEVFPNADSYHAGVDPVRAETLQYITEQIGQ